VDGLKKITALLKWKSFTDMKGHCILKCGTSLFRPQTSELCSVTLRVSTEGQGPEYVGPTYTKTTLN